MVLKSCRIRFSTASHLVNWKKTLSLPKASFNIHGFAAKEIVSKYAALNEKWIQCYEERLNDITNKTFWLHDGPPYANGRLHAGHALNKLLKDIIIRHHLLKGNRVIYRPGWDCHGLPIELAVQQTAAAKSPLEIRSACYRAALAAVNQQKKEFMSWGVLGDWRNPYRTFDIQYEISQLKLFMSLVERGLIVRNLQPVYWSPTSRTAIAESELEYNNSHKSISAFVAFRISYPPSQNNRYLAVWTTTVWSLPANEAVAFSPELEYAWYTDDACDKRQYLVAKSAVERIASAIGRSLSPISNGSVTHSEMNSLRYAHPFDSTKEACPVISSNHVTADLGSGLVHVAPVHGHEDWELGKKFGLPTVCPVDDTGRFTDQAGSDELVGRLAMDENDGIAVILKHLSSTSGGAHKIAVEHIIHSYPYDWRTKAPVMIRASKQWFIDLRHIRKTALKLLAEVDVQPDTLRNEFVRMLSTRDHWCISRQRCWGVPIPVFFTMPDETPILNTVVLQSIVAKFESTGSSDCWWLLPARELISEEAASLAKVDVSKLIKGNDIFDVWFDSGSSWFATNPEPNNPIVADCYVEGVDQFRGWFLSSMLLSAAVRNQAPYRRLLWHGFVVDDDGRKMSKSIGNVIEPTECISGSASRQLPAVGLDGLRIWAARSQSESLVKLGSSSLLECRQSLLRIRNTYSFILGNLKSSSSSFKQLPFSELCIVDKYILHRFGKFIEEVLSAYDSYNFRRAVNLIDRFFTSDLSHFYFSISKDRLYCDSGESLHRKSCLTTLQLLVDNLLPLLAPITPYTSEEVALQVPLHSFGPSVLSSGYKFNTEVLEQWNSPKLAAVVTTLLNIRDNWLQTAAPTDSTNFRINIAFLDEHQLFLKDIDEVVHLSSDVERFAAEIMHVESCSFHKELVSQGRSVDHHSVRSSVPFYHVDSNSSPISLNYLLTWSTIENGSKCQRCRRFSVSSGNPTANLCDRCITVTSNLQK